MQSRFEVIYCFFGYFLAPSRREGARALRDRCGGGGGKRRRAGAGGRGERRRAAAIRLPLGPPSRRPAPPRTALVAQCFASPRR
ncbi:unnamed protein product [Pieris macdunnoughi]|uniref:Uncharacterized protein n=1 Tax=Pieris macdunnoughi TaxID=345717 RepID=A0A821LAK4_9NEOP|nr:unnamed protein product [Pieris macdunnoughi]